MNPLKPDEKKVKRAPARILDALVILGGVRDLPMAPLEVFSATYGQGPTGRLQLVLQRPLYMGARLDDVLAARYAGNSLFEVFLALHAGKAGSYGLALTCDFVTLTGSLHIAPEIVLDIATVQLLGIRPWDVPADIWSREICVE